MAKTPAKKAGAAKAGAVKAVKKAPKRALCVGINDYPYDGSDLNGCVPDATEWGKLLVDHFGFSWERVRELDAKGVFAKQAEAEKEVTDLSAFRFLTNFVRRKRIIDL